ncbi:hypothetical protein M8494_27360 [Serratia ureilytica]
MSLRSDDSMLRLNLRGYAPERWWAWRKQRQGVIASKGGYENHGSTGLFRIQI